MSFNGRNFICRKPGTAPLDRLTLRERQVADYITRGRSNKLIAAALGLSPRTVEAYRARIFLKLQVRNAVELTQRCLSWRPTPPPGDGSDMPRGQWHH